MARRLSCGLALVVLGAGVTLAQEQIDSDMNWRIR